MQDTSVELIQITDTHLFKSKQSDLLGVPCNDSFQEVLALAKQHCASADFYLFSGDISQDLSEASYQYFFEQIQQFSQPKGILPGNHDEKILLQQYCQQHKLSLNSSSSLRNWQIICIDTAVPGKVYGLLDDATLARLAQDCQTAAEKHILIAMHHPPVEPNCQWLAGLNLRNADALWQLLNKFNNIKIITSGHIHQELHCKVNGIDVYATPSTCIQFKKDSAQFKLDTLAPGLRKFILSSDGTHRTEILRIAAKSYPINDASLGY